MDSASWRKVRNFCIEMIIYALLVIIYLYLVVTYLSDWLLDLYNNNLVAYAFVALAFIVGQGVLLDWLSTAIMDGLGLHEPD